MGRKKNIGQNEEGPSIDEIWYARHREGKSGLSFWEQQCLELISLPITDAIERGMKRIKFKGLLDIEILLGALLYEEQVFFKEKVLAICQKIREVVRRILDQMNNS